MAAYAEMESGKRNCKHQQRSVLDQHREAAGLAFRVFLLTAGRVVVDAAGRDHQDAGDRDCAKQRGEQEHCQVAVVPAEIAGCRRADHVSGMIKGLVAAVLSVEAALLDDAERDAGDRRNDGRTCDRRRNLGQGHSPECLRQKDGGGCYDDRDAGHDHPCSLVARGVDAAADRGRNQHAGDTAEGHCSPDQPAAPAMQLQEYPDERPDSRLHVRHEEVDGKQRPQACRGSGSSCFAAVHVP
ncbi:hypothetical protein ACVILK_002421 [Bradyrhizobium embrapense]